MEKLISAEKLIADFTREALGLNARITNINNGSLIATTGNSPRFAVMSGVHGDERSGPLAIVEWVKENKKKIKQGKFEFWFMPLLNIRGWNENKRNSGLYNPNREFFKSTKLTFLKPVMDSLAEKAPLVFIDLHEDSTEKEPYFWKFKEEKPRLADYLASGFNVETYPWEWDYYRNGKISSDEFVRKLGCNETVTTEIHPDEPLEKRIKFQMRCIDLGLDYANKLI